jgi:AcrR family transcriptional regulator
MARPQTASDDEILEAARTVIERRGLEGFTLSEVAEEVGLSRAAITLRFKSAHELKRRMLEQNVERYLILLDTLPKTPSGEHLLEIAAFIGKIMGKRTNYAACLGIFSGFMKVDDLAEIERRRADALLVAISRCMPQVAIPHEEAVLSFRANINGSMVAWLCDACTDPSIYLVERTKQWLTLAQIPFNAAFSGMWMSLPSAPSETAPAPARPPRPRRAS